MWRRRLFRVALVFLSLLQADMAQPQSLAEAARKEAERRRTMERQGVEEKVISRDLRAERDNRSEPASVPAFSRVSNTGRAPKNPVALQAVRSALRKLDSNILQTEEKLTNYRARLESEKWQLPKVGKLTRGNNSSAMEKLRLQIQELESKLKRLRRERYDTYEVGKKAGYLPGELDGRGIVP